MSNNITSLGNNYNDDIREKYNVYNYDKIKWVSNFSILTKRTHSYGGIVGGSYDKKISDTQQRTKSKKIKVKRVYNVFFKPAQLNFKHLYVESKPNLKIAFQNVTEPIFGKRLNPDKKKFLIETGNGNLISRNMPPLVYFSGGKISCAFKDYNNQIREWGYYMGTIEDIHRLNTIGDNIEIKPNELEFVKLDNFNMKNIRIRPELFACKGEFDHLEKSNRDILYKAYEKHLSENLVKLYIAGIIYHNISPVDAIQEITTISDKIPKKIYMEILNHIREISGGVYKKTNKIDLKKINLSKNKLNRQKVELFNKLYQSGTIRTSQDGFQDLNKKAEKLDDIEFEEQLDKEFEYYDSNQSRQNRNKLVNKTEFRLLEQDNIHNKTIQQLCPVSEFKKLKSQELTRNFMHLDTPFRSLLVYHGLGTGKTCLAITIAETYKKFVEKTGRKIIIILSRSIYENFLKELYNFKQEQKENKFKLERGALQCAGDVYHTPEYLTPKERVKLRNKKIFEYYDILTYGTVKNTFEKIIKKYYPSETRGKNFKLTPDLIEKYKKEPFVRERLKKIFNNRLIIVDEIHNMRDSIKEDEKLGSKLIEEYLKIGERNKLVLLTATPIYNQIWEITYLLNLLRMNDRQPLIPDNFLSRADYESLVNNVDKLRQLGEYAKGYVSYLRGENPINFPQKIFAQHPTYFPNCAVDYAGRQYNNSMYEYRNSVIPLTHTLLSPKQLFYIKSLVFGIRKDIPLETTEEKFHLLGKSISNIVFPGPNETIQLEDGVLIHQFDEKDDKIRYGSKGFLFNDKEKNEINGSFVKVPDTRNKYIPVKETAYVDYIDEKGKEEKVFFLDHRVVQCFSVKYKMILEDIRTHPNELIFIYSEYRKSGVYPICLMLEYYGYKRFGKEPHGNMLQMDPKNKNLNYIQKPSGKSYILLEGDIGTDERARLVDLYNDPSNRNADNIHIIIGTKVMGEGIDMKNIRQIHILNPWFNFSRMDQVIGRGVRYCSHINVEEDKRNVEVKIYGSSAIPYETILQKENRTMDKPMPYLEMDVTEEQDDYEPIDRETTDEYIYRLAVEKDFVFQKIFKVLKQNAIDFDLNRNANYFGGEFGNKGDKDFSRECHYEECNWMNEPKLLNTLDVSNNDTYNYKKTIQILTDLQRIILKVLQKNKKAFTYEELNEIITIEYRKKNNGEIPKQNLINYILQKLIKKNKVLYTFNQYVFVPKQLRHQEYTKFGLEYLLNPLLFNVRSGLELGAKQKLNTIEEIFRNKQKISKCDFIKWVKKCILKANEMMALFNISFNQFNFIFYNILMKNESDNIIYYLINAVLNLPQKVQLFSEIEFMPQSGGNNYFYYHFLFNVFDFLNISESKSKDRKIIKFIYRLDSIEYLIIFDTINYTPEIITNPSDITFFKAKYDINTLLNSSAIPRQDIRYREFRLNDRVTKGHPFNVLFIEQKKRKNKKDLFDMLKEHFKYNEFFGYIEYDSFKKKYVFRFVSSVVRKTSVAKATMTFTGQNCATWKNSNKHEFLVKVVREYNKISNYNLQFNVAKVQSKDYCNYIQYFLYECHKLTTEKERKYLIELFVV